MPRHYCLNAGSLMRVRPRLPLQRVVLAAIARPRIERIDHVLQLGRQFRNIPQQDALQRRTGCLCPFGVPASIISGPGPLWFTQLMPSVV